MAWTLAWWLLLHVVAVAWHRVAAGDIGTTSSRPTITPGDNRAGASTGFDVSIAKFSTPLTGKDDKIIIKKLDNWALSHNEDTKCSIVHGGQTVPVNKTVVSDQTITVWLNGDIAITNATVLTKITCTAVKAPGTAKEQPLAEIVTKAQNAQKDQATDVKCSTIRPNVLGAVEKTLVPDDNRTAMVVTLKTTISSFSNSLSSGDNIVLGPFPDGWKFNEGTSPASTICTINSANSATETVDPRTVEITVGVAITAGVETVIECGSIRLPREARGSTRMGIKTTDSSGNTKDQTATAKLGAVLACPASAMCPVGTYVSGDKACGASLNCNDCDLGHYCKGGVAEKRKCPSGTYGNETNLTSSGQCRTCPNSKYYFPAGATASSQCESCPSTTAHDDATATCKCALNYYLAPANAGKAIVHPIECEKEGRWHTGPYSKCPQNCKRADSGTLVRTRAVYCRLFDDLSSTPTEVNASHCGEAFAGKKPTTTVKCNDFLCTNVAKVHALVCSDNSMCSGNGICRIDDAPMNNVSTCQCTPLWAGKNATNQCMQEKEKGDQEHRWGVTKAFGKCSKGCNGERTRNLTCYSYAWNTTDPSSTDNCPVLSFMSAPSPSPSPAAEASSNSSNTTKKTTSPATTRKSVLESAACNVQDCKTPWVEVRWVVPNQKYKIVGSGLLVQQAFEQAYRAELAYFMNMSFEGVHIENITESERTYARTESPTSGSPGPSPSAVSQNASAGTPSPAPSPSDTSPAPAPGTHYSVNVTLRLLSGCSSAAKKTLFEGAIHRSVGFYMRQAVALGIAPEVRVRNPSGSNSCVKPTDPGGAESVNTPDIGLILGVTLGSLAFVGLASFGGWKLYLKRKENQEKFSEKDVELGRTTTNPLSDWSENVDESSGQTYYVNAKTRRSTWTQPDTADDWSTHRDEGSGQTYYVHKKTRRTTWTLPEVLNYANHEQQKLDTLKATFGKGKKKKSSKKKSGTKAKKSGDWTRHVDGSTGATYYSSNKSRRSTWSKPDDFDTECPPTKTKEKKSIIARASSYFKRTIPTDEDGNPLKCSQCYNDVYLDGMCMHHFKSQHEKVQRANDRRRKKFFGDQ
eukprot:g2160.t1